MTKRICDLATALWTCVLTTPVLAVVLLVMPAASPDGAASAADYELLVDDVGSKRYVRLGLGKSMIVRLPRPAADVLVSDPTTVDAVTRTATTTYLIGKQIGLTNTFFFDAQGREILNLEIQVERDLAVLARMLRKVVPGSDVKLESINDNVILTGSVSSPAESDQVAQVAARFVGKPEQVLNMLSIAGKDQVSLKVTVVEMQRTVLKQLGVDLTAAFSIGQAVLDLATVNPFTLNTQGALSGTRFAGTFTDGGTSVGSVLRAMERNGLIRTLAEPTLTAVSGESAKFLAGGEFPVPVGGDDGQVTIEFKPFGVGLGFTPVVLTEGRISLKVSTEVSELSTDNALQLTSGNANASLTIPSLVTRRAETVVEMPSGGSLVMAGLIKEQTKQQLNGIPGIKDLPILGTLFRSRDFARADTELVVIVTPYIVAPVASDRLARPDQGLNIAHDAGTVLLGRLNKVYGASGRTLPKGVYHGNYGFIVE
jgi:pilus assembly protein CpaC